MATPTDMLPDVQDLKSLVGDKQPRYYPLSPDQDTCLLNMLYQNGKLTSTKTEHKWMERFVKRGLVFKADEYSNGDCFWKLTSQGERYVYALPGYDDIPF